MRLMNSNLTFMLKYISFHTIQQHKILFVLRMSINLTGEASTVNYATNFHQKSISLFYCGSKGNLSSLPLRARFHMYLYRYGSHCVLETLMLVPSEQTWHPLALQVKTSADSCKYGFLSASALRLCRGEYYSGVQADLFTTVSPPSLKVRQTLSIKTHSEGILAFLLPPPCVQALFQGFFLTLGCS